MKQGHQKLCSNIMVGLLTAVLALVGSQSAWADNAGTGPSHADLTEMSIQDLMNVTVYGASKFDQKLSEAPSSVSVITSDEIGKYGYRTVADVLRGVRGFIVTNDRNYSYVGVRGFGRTGDWNSRILVLVDGHRMNEITYDSVYVGNEAILDIDLVDRIEVIRGPSSSLYGDNAFFAVINITTKKGPDLQATEVSAEAGSQSTYRGRASFGRRLENGHEILLSGTSMDSEGNDRLYFTEYDPAVSAEPRAANNGVAENLDEEQHKSAFAKYRAGDLTFEGAYVKQKKKVPTASFAAGFNDPRYLTEDNRAFLDLIYNTTLGSGTKLLGKVYFDQYWYHAFFPYDPTMGIEMNKDFASANWWGAEVQMIKTLLERHTIVAGADFQNNEKSRFVNYDEDPYFLYIDSNRRSKKWSVFLQDEARLSRTFILNAGVRYDHYETFGSTANPRAALIYSPAESSAFKLLFGRAFRAPNQYELYFDSPAWGQKGNPDLNPETISTYELVYEQRIGEHITTTLAGFFNRIKNLIALEQDPADSLYVYRNHEGAQARGVEAEIEAKWQNGIRNRVSYTFTPTAEDLDTEQRLANSPRHMAKGAVIIPVISQKLFVDLDAQYIGERSLVTGESTGGVVVANATLFSRSMIPGLEASVSVYNLLDRQYGDPGGEDHLPLTTIKQDGRTYRVKLTYAF